MLLLPASTARAGEGADCPPIKDKPGAIPHVDYEGVQHLTYCYGPVSVSSGQDIIRLNPAADPDGTKLFPQVPGYITRFDPELVYTDGTVPPVDVLHLHHAVWIVNFNPQFASGEEKSILQLPRGFGWRSRPSDGWLLNDMLHDQIGRPAEVYVVWRIDFVPDTSPAAASMKTVRTKWMDVAGIRFYPVFDSLLSMGGKRRYTFPGQATGNERAKVGFAQAWTIDRPVTLIGTVGHLHPGGLKVGLRVWRRGGRKGYSRALFRSWAKYYEPRGPVSWDMSMTATPENWRVILQPGDALSVHATYESKRADWYEVMGIMPVAVYDGTDVGGVDPFSGAVPQNGILTHGHLPENYNHGGRRTRLPDARELRGVRWSRPVFIDGFQYQQGDLHSDGRAGRPPTIKPGQQLRFLNRDAAQNIYHTVTGCRAPCNRSTGLAYPIANGPVSFDSGELGFNYNPLYNAPAADRAGWKTPRNLKPGTYNYFCRIHPFMRGSFRVAEPKGEEKNGKNGNGA